MRRLLNTLFVTSEDAYLTLDGENIVVRREKEEAARFPLHNLEEIVSFSYAGASPALMGACTRRNIGLSFCTPSGRFLARTAGVETGNVLLRREQYRIADDPAASCQIAKLMIWGKLYNGRWSIERTKRDHKLRIDAERFENASAAIRDILPQVMEAGSLDSLRGLEGAAASVYFEVFDDMILRSKETFYYRGRNRRPPLDNVNAMLSFSYSLLAGSCASALESVGLDAYVGFLHRDRPGRTSLALDLMEELRPCMADRFVLTLINNQVMRAEDFETAENGAVLMTDMSRRKFLKSWQERKQETITHPYLGEKLPWGLVPLHAGPAAGAVSAPLGDPDARSAVSLEVSLCWFLISYDVNTQDAAGRRRLRLIAKQCVNYGQRVQNSVFECILDAAQCRQLQHKLCSLMDKEKDSLRFYYSAIAMKPRWNTSRSMFAYQPEGVLMV